MRPLMLNRKQCLVTLLEDGTASPQVQLQHTGSANPILIHRHLAPGDAADLLQPGEQVVLQPRDAFSLLCTQPDLAVTVQEVQTGPVHPAARQPPPLQPPAAADQATGRSSSSLAEAATLDDAGGQMPAIAGARAHLSQPVVAAAAAVNGGQRTGATPQARSGAPTAPQQQQQQQQAVARKVMPAGTHPIMVLLVGVPGSGKSTFSQQLQQRSPLPWVRVNQDIVQKKSGKREVCEQQAAAALRSRQCVLVDRCHVTPDQRQHFIRLARDQGAPCHVLVLALPAALCRQRAAGRSQHEGGVQGPGAVRVVGMMQGMFDKAGLPQMAEGMDSITICRNDAQVAAALAAWSSFGTPAAAAAAAAGGVSGGQVRGPSVGSPSPTQQQQQQQQQQEQQQGADGSGGLVSAADVLQALRHLQPPAMPAAAGPRSAGQQTMSSTTAAAAAAAAGLVAGGNQGSADPGRSKRPKVTPATQQQQQQPAVGGMTPPGVASGQKNAFAVLMQGSAADAAAGGGGAGSSGAQHQPRARTPPQQQQQQGGRAGWNQVLAQVARDPAAHMSTQTIFYVDDQVVGMVDGYPKAKHHYLFVARTPGLNKASDLSSQHLALLAHMKAVACHCASLASKDQLLGTGRLVLPLQQQQQQCSVPEGWMLGFHSVPSMAQLHLHALTTDLCSPCVKHKKHWNSFTTAFFLPVDHVVDQLERHGSVAVDVGAAEALLKGPLVCQVCGQVLGTMPALKQHVQAHFP